MSDAATTTLSRKGQVVIPETIRERLGLKRGAQFVVVADHDVVILKVREPLVGTLNSRLIVSGNKHLLRVSGWRGIDVLKARPFVDRYIEATDI